ncbi:MAG TPA: 1-(5-phosphoribosyl)-5-[(5-phosphoribosylamino)methylideneamino] imidazole-4-carboxamide isomerase [Gemmatimonadales bacterium]|nr:1-(5-phosphoribosyl)-5-[(5-phosphoribosylamino)methylideneamino] imidazole-4-carboxamide isomerase [Gemmatimonadales bacterium]
MELFPAIDIRGGRVVRLSQGSAARETVYDDDPVRVAEGFVGAGARWIHLVDLDRAFDQGDNDEAIRRVADRVAARVRLQLGGGLRTLDRVIGALDLGVARLVIGTAAATDPAMLDAAISLAPAERFAVGVDARDGFVAVRGWTETSTLRATDLARRVVEQGIGTLIYTDVTRDGMLQGPDLAGAVALQAVGAQVVASGGVASLADLRRLGQAGLAGAIVGRALYEGRIALGDALALARDEFSAA